jgi:hypothetical protein
MKKDIKFPPVENVFFAVARETTELNEYTWNVYLLNKNDFGLKDVFIRSKGYGTSNGEDQQTSILRHHISWLEANDYALIEPIDPSVFHLNNEYWISYFIDGQIFDKKFIFVPESIIEQNLIFIPELNKEGILHN